ncbi:MAG: DUF1585 domain-containing protein [Acidobacteria bacterium]|nr:DUF1585 domain-containing protein [Acidobacteriota bacterium]
MAASSPSRPTRRGPRRWCAASTCWTTSWARRRRRRRRTCRPWRTRPATGTSPHRRNPACATCHLRMDPLGFALENFDGIGRWRETDGVTPIDASGELPDGTAFDGPVEFREALLDRSGEFVRTFTQKLLTYALGRPVQHYDIPAVRAILRDAAGADHRWSSLVLGIVESPPFQMRRAREDAAVVVQQ